MTKKELANARRIAKIFFSRAEDVKAGNVLVIDRRFWGRGEKSLGTLLTEEENGGIQLCCLGFACLFGGMKAHNIYDSGSPAYARRSVKGDDLVKLPKPLELLARKNGDSLTDSAITTALIEVNDANLGSRITKATYRTLGGNIPVNRKLATESQRERLITRLFKLANIEVEFVN